MILKHKKSIVVIGNGMVGHRFCERLVEYDTNHDYQITVFGEEPRPVYDRVQLTSYFAHRDPIKLQIADRKWYEDRHIALSLGDPVVHIDRANRLLRSASGKEVRHDADPDSRDRVGSVRAAGAGDRQEGGLRLSHDRGPGEDHGVLERLEALCRDRRRTSRPGGGEGGLRSRTRNACRRVRFPAHAAAGRRCGLEGARRQDRIARRQGSPRQEHAGDRRQWSGRGDGLRGRQPARCRHDCRLRRHQAARDDLAGACGLAGRFARRRRRRQAIAHFRFRCLRDRRGRPVRRHDLRPDRSRLRHGRDRGLPDHGARPRVQRRGHVDQAEAHGRRRGQLRQPVRRRQDCAWHRLRGSVRRHLQEAALQPGRNRVSSAASWSAMRPNTALSSHFARARNRWR